MRLRVLTVATLILGLNAPFVAQRGVPPARRPPNVVLILMDDMGYGDIGSYGVRDARTPNLDRLAREGVRLTDAYANGPVCTPTRAALVTGRYQQRVGLEWALSTSAADLEQGLPASGTSLPALLKENGYATGLIGKWHLGVKPEFGPNRHGFDEFFGFLSGAVDYYTHRRHSDGRPDLYENTTPVESPGYLTDQIADRAVRFIDRHAGAPFFLEVAFNAVHWPFQVPDRPSDMSTERSGNLDQQPDEPRPATRRDYVRMLERADQGIGRILTVIEKRGLARDTLVIFTSDNGGEWLSRNAPLFHRKHTLWEGGIRVPLILRWPNQLPAGHTSKQVTVTMDLTASILAATATPVPAGHRLDGLNVLPVLRGESPPLERQLFWRIVRTEQRQKAARSGRWKYLMDGENQLLFDLETDVGERHDLAAQRPDLVLKLRALLADWERDVDQKGRTSQ
jgi:arylsulfatase A-like enzyme